MLNPVYYQVRADSRVNGGTEKKLQGVLLGFHCDLNILNITHETRTLDYRQNDILL